MDYPDERMQLTFGFYGDGDFFTMKGVVETLLSGLGAKKREEPEKTAPESEEFKPDGELAAVIGAAVAEESGVDVKNIKIVSIKKV